jgi:hypothetical protein
MLRRQMPHTGILNTLNIKAAVTPWHDVAEPNIPPHIELIWMDIEEESTHI